MQGNNGIAGTPEVRKYRLRYWDKGLANGDRSDITASNNRRAATIWAILLALK